MDWQELLSRVRKDERSILFGAPAVLFIFLLAIGCGLASLVVCTVCVVIGYAIADWSSTSNGHFLSPLVEHLLGQGMRETKIVQQPQTVQEEEGEGKRGKEKKPWSDLLVPASVNSSLEVLVEEMVEQYVNNWYGGGISHDRAFLNEIRYQVRFLAARLFYALQKVDLSRFVLEKVLPAAALHVRRVADAESACEASSTPSTLESAIAERMKGVHYALRSRQHEVDYLRQVVDYLLPHLLDERRLAGRAHDDDSPSHVRRGADGVGKKRPWPSHPARHFIRELLTHSTLLPLLDTIADPDTINHLLCLLFDPTPVSEQQEEPRRLVPFLHGLTEGAVDDIPDSLLQLKLSDILPDARLFSMFRLYLADTGGPVAELKFVADARRIHDQMQKKEGTSSETTFDAWTLYTTFVHESAPERIPFTDNTVDAFRSAVEGNDLKTLDRIVEQTYQEVYNRMQYEHVVPFCQSENFMGHLCGSPPSTLDELDELLQQRPSNDTDEAPASEKAFSFALFRNQLLSAIKAEPTEEDEDENEDQEMVEMMEVEGEDEEVEKEEKNGEEDMERSRASSLPAIDVSFADDSLDGDQSSPCMYDLPSPAGSTTALSTTSSQGEICMDLVIDPDRRDINRWRVTIPSVVPVKEPVNGRWYYAYCIEVQRGADADESETTSWSIVRRYGEFFVLESKLLEFHADSLSFPGLPPRKMFVSRTREFVDQYRLTFSAFLSGLCKQTLLARSDLLFAFLTSREEFRESLNLSELNPLKMVRKVPSRLTREKGQNLKPFLLQLMAGVLAEAGSTNTDRLRSDDEDRSRDDEQGREDDRSVSSIGSAPFSLYSTIYGHNFSSTPLLSIEKSARKWNDDVEETNGWTRSALDSLILLSLPWFSSLLQSPLPYGIRSLLGRCCVFLVRVCSRGTFDEALRILLGRVLERALADASLVSCIQLLQQTLFCWEDVVVTDQEKALRMELAERRTLQFIEDSLPPQLLRLFPLRCIRSTVSSWLHMLQFACLNKQLSYVLLDQIVQELFPLRGREISHPLQG